MFDLRTSRSSLADKRAPDRAALDFAIEHGIPHGGWCPRDRLAEDGSIPPRYELRETPSHKYAQRTEWNVRDSDATVLFTIAASTDARRYGAHPGVGRAARQAVAAPGGWRIVGPQPSSRPPAGCRLSWRSTKWPGLNVAGPRASQEPGVADFVGQVLATVWAAGNARNM